MPGQIYIYTVDESGDESTGPSNFRSATTEVCIQ